MAKKESIQNFGMGKRGREKIVECAINPFIPFIEKHGLRGGGEALARRYHDMSSSQTRKTPRRGDIFGTCSYFCFLDIFFDNQTPLFTFDRSCYIADCLFVIEK